MVSHEGESGAELLAAHLAECSGTQAAIVVDGNADDEIAALAAAGWGVTGEVEYIAGKRIRYLTVPPGATGQAQD